MTAALALSIAPEAVRSEALRERVQVLESRPGVREFLLVTDGRTALPGTHAVIVLGGGGGGFAVTSLEGVTQVHGGLPTPERRRLAKAIAGPVVAVSPPTDRPVMDREWRLSERHVTDLQAAVNWMRVQWPHSQTWMLGFDQGALSAAVAAASIEDLAGAVLLSCAEEALERPQKSERMRVLAVRSRYEREPEQAAMMRIGGRKTLVTVRDAREPHPHVAYGDAANAQHFNGKDQQVVDVVARWILTGAAPDEIR